MSEAEREKFQLIKNINDQELILQHLESSTSNLQAQLSKLKEQNQRMEQPEIDVYMYTNMNMCV